jgi:hypothetical protein
MNPNLDSNGPNPSQSILRIHARSSAAITTPPKTFPQSPQPRPVAMVQYNWEALHAHRITDYRRTTNYIAVDPNNPLIPNATLGFPGRKAPAADYQEVVPVLLFMTVAQNAFVATSAGAQ